MKVGVGLEGHATGVEFGPVEPPGRGGVLIEELPQGVGRLPESGLILLHAGIRQSMNRRVLLAGDCRVDQRITHPGVPPVEVRKAPDSGRARVRNPGGMRRELPRKCRT